MRIVKEIEIPHESNVKLVGKPNEREDEEYEDYEVLDEEEGERYEVESLRQQVQLLQERDTQVTQLLTTTSHHLKLLGRAMFSIAAKFDAEVLSCDAEVLSREEH